MSKDIGSLLKQAQKMQSMLSEVRLGLSNMTFEAASGGGMVTAVANGSLKLVSIKIDPSVVNSNDVEMLEDLIVSSVNEALKRAEEAISKEMGKVTAGLGANIPGLF